MGLLSSEDTSQPERKRYGVHDVLGMHILPSWGKGYMHIYITPPLHTHVYGTYMKRGIFMGM